MSIENPSPTEGTLSSHGQVTREDMERSGCEVRCDWRELATEQGIDTTNFTYEQCREIREGLALKGLATCGMAGISVCIAGEGGYLS